MPVSQNLRFAASPAENPEFDHPLGASLMRELSAELTEDGWDTDEMENWRDCGWFVGCRRGASELEVVVSQIEDGQWMLQVSPRHIPGFVSGLFGSKVSAPPASVHELAVAVHRLLSKLNYLGNPLWRWDGFPDEEFSMPEPQRAE
jgi:hypothetical protein